MVSFICDACGQTVKKQKVEKHYQTECRNCSVLSCIDCGKDFPGDSYASHTSCISEAEKYQGKLYKAKDKSNKGERKQQEWLEQVRNASNESGKQDPRVRKLLAKITAYDNVPRKEGKFKKFCENSINVRDADLLKKLWEVFSGVKQNPTPSNNESGSRSDETKSEMIDREKSNAERSGYENSLGSSSETMNAKNNEHGDLPNVCNETNEATNEKKESKKKKKKKRKIEAELDQEEQKSSLGSSSETMNAKNNDRDFPSMCNETNEAENEKKESKGKKRKKRKIETEQEQEERNGIMKKTDEDGGKKKKKRKRNDEDSEQHPHSTDCVKVEEENCDENKSTVPKETFKWESTIKKLLKSAPDQEMSIKKLRKKVLSEYQACGGDSRPRTEQELKVLFEKKLHKNPKVKVHKERAKLC